MSIPKEPRQQMINLMYLVLTALLALNVSAEILNAFKLVSDGMNVSNHVINAKNETIMVQFVAKADQNKSDKRVQELLADAQKAKELSEDFVKYVNGIRDTIIMASGGYIIDGNDTLDLRGKKNYDIPTHIMIQGGKGKALEERIEELRNQLKSLHSLTPAEQEKIGNQLTLNTTYNKKAAKLLGKKDWEEYNFDHVPVIAVNTLLTKFKGDAINSAGLIIETLFKKVGEVNYDFDALSPMINASSNYVLDGQKYSAKIFLSAFSTTAKPEIYLGQLKPGLQKEASGTYKKVTENPVVGGGTAMTADKVQDGQGLFEETASGTGERKHSGAIKVRKPNSNDFEYYPFELSYVAAEAAVVVSPDKMNVFYIGVDNPVSISVPGYGSDKISANMAGNGSIAKNGGNSGGYTVRVTTPGKTQVVVSAKGDDGKMKSFPPKEFRIKRVPDPIAKVGSSPGGKIPAAQFKVQRGVLAVLENFDFELKFNVVGFDMTYAAKRQDLLTKSAKGPAFTDEMNEYLKRAKPGDVFYLDEIRVQGPDGQTRKLPSIVFQLI